jgi:hypothetical protein
MNQPDSSSGLRRWLWILALLLLLLFIGILYLLLNRPSCPSCPVTVVTATQVAMEPSHTPTALPITPTASATATPTPATPEEPTPEIIDGNTGERPGGGNGNDDSLPPKGDEVPPLDGEAGTKPVAEEVQPGDTRELVDRYGDEAKPEGNVDASGTTGGVVMVPNPVEAPRGRYAQLSFTMTENEVRPDIIQTLPGTLPISPILRGEILYVIYAQGDEQPIYVGTFFDPLVAYGTIQDDRGHSVVRFESGSASISLPQELTDPQAMVQATIVFYRLDPSLQDSTVVSIDNLETLLANATLISRLAAENLIPLLRQEG